LIAFFAIIETPQNYLERTVIANEENANAAHFSMTNPSPHRRSKSSAASFSIIANGPVWPTVEPGSITFTAHGTIAEIPPRATPTALWLHLLDRASTLTIRIKTIGRIPLELSGWAALGLSAPSRSPAKT
jgi:hypothetical protein